MNTNVLPKVSTADVSLIRICTFDTERLAPFVFEEGKKQLYELDKITTMLTDMKDEVMDILYNTIPEMNNKQISGIMINLKRRLYNGRTIQLDKLKNFEIIQYFCSKDQVVFDRWMGLMERMRNLEQKFELSYQHQSSKEEEQVYMNFSTYEHDFFRGLPIINQGYASFLPTRKRKHWKVGSNLMKSAYSYFLRGTLKTSPLGTITQLSTTTYTNNATHPATDRHLMRWSRALVSYVFENTSLVYDFKDLFTYKMTERIPHSHDTYAAQRIRGIYSTKNNVFSKTEDIIRHNQYLPQLDKLGEEHHTYSSLIENVYHPNADDFIHYLATQKLIRPIMPFTIESPNPFFVLSEHIRNHQHFKEDKHGLYCSLLEEMEEIKNDMTKHPTFNNRNEKMKLLNQKLSQLFQLIKCEKPDWLHSSPLIYEDVRSNFTVPKLGNHVKDDILKLQNYIQSFFYSHTLYEKLVDVFKEKVGKGGEINLMKFLSDILESETLYSRLIKEARKNDIHKVTRGESLMNGQMAEEPKTATIYYQLAANSYADIENGDYLLVVNKVTEGSGNIFARFNYLFDKEKYRDPLMSLLEKSYHYLNIRQVSFGGDWSNLQERYNMLKQYINWPGELINKNDQEQLSITELYLRHNPVTDKLNFYTENGQPLKPIYLGSVPEHMLMGLSKLFTTLIKPFFIRTPFGSNPLNNPKVYNRTINIPREQRGRIVLNREKWATPLFNIKNIFEQYSERDLMKALHQWRMEHNIPEEVYITLTSNHSSVFNTAKPFWFHFYSVLSIDLLKKSMSDEYDVIIFEEAFPSVKQQWFKDNDKHYATEFMAFGVAHQ